VGAGTFLIIHSKGHEKQTHREMKKHHNYFEQSILYVKKSKLKVALRQMHARILLQLVADPYRSVEHTLRTTTLKC